MNLLLQEIEKTTPLAFKELQDYYSKNFTQVTNQLSELPFDLLFGVCISFFRDQNLEFTIADIDVNTIYDSVIEVFTDFEKVIGHFS